MCARTQRRVIISAPMKNTKPRFCLTVREFIRDATPKTNTTRLAARGAGAKGRETSWENRHTALRHVLSTTHHSRLTTRTAQVHSLKEQMSLMQGQLVTAQQQQGTLHKKGGRHH